MNADELKELRKDMDLSQSELAKALGLTANYVSMIERGEKPIEARTAWMVDFIHAHWRQSQAYRDQIEQMESGRLKTRHGADDTTLASIKTTRRSLQDNDRLLNRVLSGELLSRRERLLTSRSRLEELLEAYQSGRVSHYDEDESGELNRDTTAEQIDRLTQQVRDLDRRIDELDRA